MLGITKRISNYNHYNYNDIKYLVLHDTGNYKDTASANANYFCTGNRNASAHYFVDNTSIWQVVEDRCGAWHCGDGHGKYGITNTNSIGIEMCNSGGYISEQTISNTLELVRYLMQKYNISTDRVVRHYDASRKVCPHNMSSNNWAKWKEFKSRLANVKNKKEEKKVENIVIYNYGTDLHSAEILADYLNCPTISNSRKFDYSCVQNVYAVGGTKGQYTSYLTKLISGKNRYDTCQAVLNYINKR